VNGGCHSTGVNGIGPDLTRTPQLDYLRCGLDSDLVAWRAWLLVGRVGWPQ
jgi:hypothetical protein